MKRELQPRPPDYHLLPREQQDAWYRENVDAKSLRSNELVTEDQAAIEFTRRHAGSLRFVMMPAPGTNGPAQFGG